MKLSNHTIVVENFPQKNEHLLFNTRTQALIKINQELKDFLQNPATELKVKFDKELEALHANGIVVNDEEEDKLKLENFFNQLKFNFKKNFLTVSIVTTYKCNFDCPYCFEKSINNNESMSWDTAALSVEWLKQYLIKNKFEGLYIIFYGGEPFLNKKVMEGIIFYMDMWCKSRNISFKFMIQTNGSLLSINDINYYKNFGLDQIRVSLDGIGENHNKTRYFKAGGGSFDTIIKNILSCVYTTKIGISTCYENGDISQIEKIINYFDELGILEKLGEFMFSPIHPTLGPNKNPKNIQNCHCMYNYDDKNLIKSALKIRKLLAEKKLPFKSGMSIAACPLTRDYSGVTIDPHGDLYKCNSMLGHNSFSVGNVKNEEFNEKYYEFLNLDTWKKCPQDCRYLPMCSAGCRLFSYFKNGNFSTPVCFKNYLDVMTPEFIKEEYEFLDQK